MYYLKWLSLILLLFLSLGMVSAENPAEALNGGGENEDVLTLNESIVIDDFNFNSYFDDDGYIISDDIKENSTIYFGNISNRNVIINIPLNMQPYTPNSQIINSTFRITDDGSGSAIRNFVFNSTLTSRNPEYYAPIIIDEASDVDVENNIIYMEYFDGCNYNLVALSIYGESLNNFVSGNRITIISNSKSRDEHYIYGIQITGSSINGGVFARNSPSGNIIKYNAITIDSEYYASGIYTSFIKHTVIDNNEVNLKAKNFTYGIVCDYFFASSDMLQSTNISISHNRVNSNSSMAYLIQIFNIDDVTIYNNTIYADANAAYGISGYSCNNHSVFNNQIEVNGKDISLVGINVDAIATGHNGIYYMMDSSCLTIHDNNVLSNYTLGGDYAIRFDSSSAYNINVYDNNLSSNHLEYNGNNAVFGEVNVYNNNPYYFNGGVINYTTYVTYEIYVDINGDDINGNASKENPFATLNKAITYLKILTLQNTNKSVGIKGIIYMANGTYVGFGSNLRMTISGLNVDIIGSANTTIDGGNSNWFFEISDDSTASLQNINFINGLCRGKESGVILNNGFLTLKNCNISNCRVNDLSAIIYNNGILKLSKNNLTENKVKHIIYNTKGKTENIIIDFIGNSSNNVLNINSSYVTLTAYVHDDMGNPISGGFVKFYIQGKEVYTTGNLVGGIAKSNALIALTGSLKVSGFYSNVYSNAFINYGIINSTVIVDGIIFYVNENGSDIDGDGSKENPFKTINKVFTLGSPTSQMIIYLSEGNFKDKLSKFNSAYTITISGVENKTYISADWIVNDIKSLKLQNLIFNKYKVNATNTNLEINNCLFTNSVKTPLISVGGTLLVVDSTFKNNGVNPSHNKETDWGGAIYKAYGNLTVIRSLFDGNEAAHGGAIYSNQSDLYISKSKFINNLAFCGYLNQVYSSGGAILQYLGREVIISDTSFEDNTANSFGGAFYSLGIQPCVKSVSEPFLEPGYFIDGGPYLRDPVYKGFVGDLDSPQDIYFINCNFTNNLAPIGGGAVFIANNSFTEYIGCRFDSNLAFTYDSALLFNTIKSNWVSYDWYSDSIGLTFMIEKNYGAAINDKNLHIVDSYFEANTYSSGGSLLLPAVVTSEREFDYISRHNVGTTVKTVSNGEELYVSDSSILTGEDSRFLGISGWTGTYEGPSINKQIKDYTRPGNGNGNGNGDGEEGSESGGNGEGSGNGNGNGNGEGSGTGEGSGSGSGSSQGNALTMGDMLNYLSANGSNLVSNNGNGISVADIMNLINSHNQNTVPVSNASSAENDKDIVNNNPSSNVNPVNVSSADVVEVNSSSSNTNPNNSSSDVDTNSSNVNPNNATSSENLIEVNSTSDMTPEESGGHISNDQVAVDVGESSNPLTGVNSDDNADSSQTPSAQDSSAGASDDSNGGGTSDSSASPTSPSDAGSSSGAHEISKKIDDEGKLIENNNVWYSFLIVIILCILLIIGYKSRKDEEE